jgi:transposase
MPSTKRAGLVFGLQRALTGLGIECHVVTPQKLDERNQRVKTDGRDAKALCLKLDRLVEGNRGALAVVRVPAPRTRCCRSSAG